VAPAITAPTLLDVDSTQTKINAVGAKITGSHPIDFPATAGKVGLDGDKLVGLSFAVDLGALVSDKEKLTAHLKDADFFDVASFPQATFVSTAVAAGAAPNAYSVTGDLSIRGKSKSIVVPVTLTPDAAQVSGSAEFTINRQDYGVAYPGKPDDLIKDEVPVKASFVAKR
jgi:polyisoprenoid-binding protein YceI